MAQPSPERAAATSTTRAPAPRRRRPAVPGQPGAAGSCRVLARRRIRSNFGWFHLTPSGPLLFRLVGLRREAAGGSVEPHDDEAFAEATSGRITPTPR